MKASRHGFAVRGTERMAQGVFAIRRAALGARAIRPVALGVLATVAVLLLPALAIAQTTTTTTTATAAVAVNPLYNYPDRILNGTDLGPSTRPQGLSPYGISYSDCISDMRLRFYVEETGFTGQAVEVWISENADCSSDANRGVSGIPGCWLVGGNASVVSATAGSGTTGATFDVRIQDIVGAQQAIPNPATQVNYGAAACNAQPTVSAVNFTVYILPVSGNTYTGGGFYQYPISADLVGPAPPTGVSIGDGDTLMIASWVANIDADTAGYDVFIDPVPGQETTSDASTATSTSTQLVCPGSSGTSNGSSTDAGCVLLSTGGTTSTGAAAACNSAPLASGMVQTGGLVEITETDEAGDVIDEGGVVETNGGLGTVPCQYLLGASCTANTPAYNAQSSTLNGEGNARYVIKGLTNGVMYTVAVSAVDAFGNPGPPSTQACATPAPIDDFWKLYREAGGQAGGGYCALQAVGSPLGSSAAGIGIGVVAVAAVRRRSRRRAR